MGIPWLRVPGSPSERSTRLFWLKVWAGIFAVIGGLDVYRMQQGNKTTLSWSIRTLFRVDTKYGAMVFLLLLIVLAIHILKY